MRYEKCNRIFSSGTGIEDNDVDDENTSKYLKRMIADFQTLMSKKDMSKDKVTSIKVKNVQVKAL